MASSRRKSSSSSDSLSNDRFADYFVICGLDEKDGLEPYQSSEADTEFLTPLQLPYKASILWHYPENEVSNSFEAAGIKLLCMPRGVYFRKNGPRKHRFHSFLQTREDGTKIYGFVLTFYEKMQNDSIILAMDTLFKMFNTGESLLESPGKSATSVVTPEKKRNKHLDRTKSFYSYSKEQEDLFVSKSICLIMKKPYVTVARKCLENILHIGLNERESEFHVESYIYNVLYEIPSPPPGRNMKYVSLDDEVVIVLNPSQHQLPYFDYSMIEVLMTLGFENLVDLFTCMLLEHQILFLSSDIHKLMLIAECLTTLFFPLHWEHVYVPVLPPSLLHFLDAPVPFIMGLYYETEEEKNRFEVPCEGALCLLDIDSNEIHLPQEIPELPGRSELIEELRTMAQKYGIKPPHGISRLRRSGSPGSSENVDFYLDLSNSHSDEDHELSSNYSSDYYTGTWPRRKQNTLQIPSKSYTNRTKLSCTNSPLISRKVLSTSNWAGETTPHIHEDSSAVVSCQNESQLQACSESTDTVNSCSNQSSESPKSINPRLAAMMALAEKAGLNTNGILKKQENSPSDSDKVTKKDDLFVLSARAMTVTRKQQHENEFNIIVREIFVNCFTQMLVDYEHFVILPQQSKEDWLNNREHMQNFDKASFISDQSQNNLPFMTLFVETQGFASLIDMKIMALWENCDPKLTYFDKRIDKLKVKLGIIRSPVYQKCTSIPTAVESYVKACSHVDHSAAQPHALKIRIQREKAVGYFPLPEKIALHETKRKKSGRINWRKRDKQQLQNDHILLNEALKEGQKIKEKLAERVKKYMQESKMITKDTVNTPGGAAQKTLSAFADKLLKECKIKTKRLVVLKLGQEAVELGHAGPNSAAIEENTLIASLCDLLERVWSHGVQLRQLEFGKESAKSRFVQRMRQSKSALWSHLLAFYQKESERLAQVYGVVDVENVAEEVKKLIIEANIQNQQQQSRKHSAVDSFAENLARAIRTRSPEPLDQRNDYDFIAYDQLSTSLPTTPSMPNMETRRQQDLLARIDLLNNLKTVLDMKEIKTDTGYARAWTRLALEKKVLTKELKILLNNKKILMSRYKDYAFIRTEDEMEQFLYHLLSLNAVDFYCFTNGFLNTMTTYKVHIVLGKQMSSATSANSWIDITGSLASTGTINAPKGALEFRFKHKNLGILSALRIGHDNTGISPGWFIEYIAVINEVTGRLYKFQCGRWLAKGHDDGSTERLLIAELLNQKHVTEKRPTEALRLGISDIPLNEPTQGVRRMSIFTKKLTSADIQEKVADSVNNIVKYFYKDSSENLTYLLCGEGGFCQALEDVFQYGFKSTRLFGKRLFVWDYIEKVHENFVEACDDNLTSTQLKLRSSLCTTIQTINTSSVALSVGKQQKFQLFMCLGLRDHNLQNWFQLLNESPVTSQLFESNSFFRDATLLNFLMEALQALSEFDVQLDKTITRGI